jgi:hypothetical protein
MEDESNRRQETRWIKLHVCNEEILISFIAKYYSFDQIKKGETKGTHCTNREEVKYVTKILVRKPERKIPLLRRGLDQKEINITIKCTGEEGS